MSSKLFLACFVGVGGSAGVYGIYTYNNSKNTIIVIDDIDSGPITKSTAICTKPIKKATIIGEDKVQYYVCESITKPTGTSVTATTNIIIDKVHNFKQINSTPTTTPDTAQDSTQGTYSHGTDTSIINFYGLSEMVNQDIFFITKSIETTPGNLTTNDGIKELVSKIERLRKEKIISIVSPVPSDNKTIDSIVCTSPKQLIINKTKEIEYYACDSITGDSDNTGDVPTEIAEQSTFEPNTEFKTKTGSNHTITKWTKTGEDTSYFFGFKPTNTSTHNTAIFFIKTTKTDIEGVKSKEMVLEIDKFLKLAQK